MKFDPTLLIRLLETIMFIFPCLILYVPIEVSCFFFYICTCISNDSSPVVYSQLHTARRTGRGGIAYSARNGARWERSVTWVGSKIERGLAPRRVWFEDDWGRVRFHCTTSERKNVLRSFLRIASPTCGLR